MSQRLALALAFAFLPSGAAWPCGGPYVFSPTLMPAAKTLAADEFDDSIEPFRFLDPFGLAGKYQGAQLVALAYGPTAEPDAQGQGPVDGDLESMEQALGRGDRAGAQAAALRAIDTLLSLPAVLADPWSDDLRRAVEFVEVEPALGETDAAQVAAVFGGESTVGGTPLLDQVLAIRAAPFDQAAATLARFPDSPRRPSLELAVLRNRMTTEIGSGWPGQIQGTTPETWAALLAAHDDWIARYPQHPLVDLARLQRLRVLYLKGDAQAAWDLLLGLYPHRPGRALWEMRHLLRNGMVPQGLDLAALPDPLLASALLGRVAPPTPAQWERLWRTSETDAAAHWAVNLQERLLLAAASAEDRLLPSGFPAEPAHPSELWGQLRTLALERAGRYPDALRQAERLDGEHNAQSAQLLATALVGLGRPAEAAALPALDDDTALYLLQVAANDDDLAAMARGGGSRAQVAAQALAMRRLGEGDWDAGARVLKGIDPERAGRWQDAAKRAADRSPAGLLALAGWLEAHRGQLFPELDPGMSRGLKQLLDTDLPPAKRQRLLDWLLHGGERERALGALASALQTLSPRDRRATAALAEADRLYNRLLNWDVSGSETYERLLAATPAAQRIRAAGKGIRAAQGGG